MLVTQSCLTLCDLMDCSPSGPSLFTEFSRQEYWNGLPFPSPGHLPNPGIKPRSPTWKAQSLPTEPPGKPYTKVGMHKLLMLLLSHLSRVRLCATPETAAHQAPPSLAFSRQEHRSGLPFPSPMHESEKWKWSCSVMSNSSRPHGLQPTGSSVHGIFQARVLEWVAIAFSRIVSRWC